MLIPHLDDRDQIPLGFCAFFSKPKIQSEPSPSQNVVFQITRALKRFGHWVMGITEMLHHSLFWSAKTAFVKWQSAFWDIPPHFSLFHRDLSNIVQTVERHTANIHYYGWWFGYLDDIGTIHAQIEKLPCQSTLQTTCTLLYSDHLPLLHWQLRTFKSWSFCLHLFSCFCPSCEYHQ